MQVKIVSAISKNFSNVAHLLSHVSVGGPRGNAQVGLYSEECQISIKPYSITQTHNKTNEKCLLGSLYMQCEYTSPAQSLFP